MKKILSLAAALAVLSSPVPPVFAQDYAVPDNTPHHIRRGVESGERTEEQLARDPARKPAEVLTLADLNEGDHIVEITSFGQYYTTILAAAVGPTGKIEMYDMPYMEDFGAVESGQAFDEAHDNAEYHVVHYSEIELPAEIDGVYNILYYHDLQPLEVDTAVMNRKIFEALRPGGKYLIVDHLAEDGSGWRHAGSIHRIGKEVILEEVLAAGFELIVDSDILAHPEDDRSTMVFSPGIRGGTDRAVLVFQKPYFVPAQAELAVPVR